jgi:hypothetical protein
VQGLAREQLQALVSLKNSLDLRGQLVKTIDDLVATLIHRRPVLGKYNCHHDESNVLGRVCLKRCNIPQLSQQSTETNLIAYLGGRNTNFWASIDVDSAMRLARDGGTDGVDNTQAQCATLVAVTHCQDGICGLARLRHKHTNIIAEDRGLAIEEIRCELDGDGDLGQLLKDRTSLKRV